MNVVDRLEAIARNQAGMFPADRELLRNVAALVRACEAMEQTDLDLYTWALLHRAMTAALAKLQEGE